MEIKFRTEGNDYIGILESDSEYQRIAILIRKQNKLIVVPKDNVEQYKEIEINGVRLTEGRVVGRWSKRVLFILDDEQVDEITEPKKKPKAKPKKEPKKEPKKKERKVKKPYKFEFKMPELSTLKDQVPYIGSNFKDEFHQKLSEKIKDKIDDYYEANPLQNWMVGYYKQLNLNFFVKWEYKKQIEKYFFAAADNVKLEDPICHQSKVGDDGSRRSKYRTGSGNSRSGFRWFCSPIDTKKRREDTVRARNAIIQGYDEATLDDFKLISLRNHL